MKKQYMTGEDRLQFLLNQPLERGGILIYFPTIDEIARMTYSFYSSMMVILMADIHEVYKESGLPKEYLDELTFLDAILRQEGELNYAASKLLQTFFKQEVTKDIFLEEKGLLIQDQPLTASLWDDIRHLILEANDIESAAEVEPVFTNEKAREIWEKQKKAEELRNRLRNKDGGSFESMLCDIISSVCSKSHTVTYANVGDLSVYQLKDHLGKLIEIEAYNLNMMFAAHGADIKDNNHWSAPKADKNGGNT